MVGQLSTYIKGHFSDASECSGEEALPVWSHCKASHTGSCGLWAEVQHQGQHQRRAHQYSVECAASSLSRGNREPTSIYLDLAKSMSISLESFLATTAKATSCATASAASFAGKSSAMIYYSVDPQFGALLFSLYSRNERCSLFTDPFATCAFAPSANTDLVGYAHSTLVQLLELSQHYACFLSQVRAGSVVLLVGVGSLVCWRLWTHWRYGGDGETAGDNTPQPSPNASPNKITQRGDGKRPGLLASLLEEELFQESEDIDEDDPAFIQQLLGLLQESVKDVLAVRLGRYFGPDSPGFQSQQQKQKLSGPLLSSSCSSKTGRGAGCCPPGAKGAPHNHRAQRHQLLGTPASGSDVTNSRNSSTHSTPSEQRYLADNSSSSSSRGRGSSSSSSGAEDMEEARAAARSRRRKKRLLKLVGTRNSASSLSGEATERERKGSDTRTICPQDDSISSSQDREQGSRVRFYANAGTDEEYSDAQQDESEGMWASASYTDLMERMRHRQARRSMSREPSVASNLSDLLMSPSPSSLRLPFKRDDSVCSNLSDFTVSECSEMSMDISVKEEVNNTFRCLEEIEHDLDDLKSSVLQMDEEVAMFVTKPDPYSLKITFSDYSLSSKEDNDSLPYIPGDSLSSSSISDAARPVAAANAINDREAFRGVFDNLSSAEIGVSSVPQVARTSDTDAECSLEWDSPRHGWSSMQTTIAERPAQKDEGLVSLEWDDGGVKQHPEPRVLSSSRREDNDLNFHDNTVVRSQLLPNHSSMELDLEEELAAMPSSLPAEIIPEPTLSLRHNTDQNVTTDFNTIQHINDSSELCPMKPDPSMTASTDSAIVTSMTASSMTISSMSTTDLNNSFTIAANMTGSTDSAFYSGPGSRSATASPLPVMFSQSALSSSGFGSFGSCSKVSSEDGAGDTAAADDAECGARPLERASSLNNSDRGRFGDGGARRIGGGGPAPGRWSSEESGFAEPDSDGPHACLSPVRELREKEYSESNSSSPRHISSSLSNICDTSTRRSTEGLNLVVNDNDNYDSLNGNSILQSNLIDQTGGKQRKSPVNSNLNETTTTSPYPTEIFDNSASHLENHYYTSRGSSYQGTDLDNDMHDTVLDDTINGNYHSEMEDRHRRSPSPASSHILTVGEKVLLQDYCDREWKGNTAKAITIRQGYSKIGEELGLSSLRCIRGDQYCGVRAAVFQALSSGHPAPRSAPALGRLVAEVAKGATWILGWNFANRIHYGNALDGIRDCLEAMDNVNDSLIGNLDRQSILEQTLNNNPRLDLQLCEAAKLHMLVNAMQLHAINTSGGNVPLFAMILFARQSSQTPTQFMTNHLNVVGDTGGLEQIEMFLLGHSLKATLQVVRPSSHGAEDFICYYPDTNIGEWPQLSLIAEDDRHYNVIVE